MREDYTRSVGRLQQCIVKVYRFQTPPTHGNNHRAILNIDHLDALHITQPARAVRGCKVVVIVVVAPQEPALENQSSTGINNRCTVSTTRGEE